jgi:hypothetical protein
MLAISVNHLLGVYGEDKDVYAWLWSREPAARVGDSIFVYDLTRDADAHARLAEVYRKADRPEAAEAELCKAEALRRDQAGTGRR